MNNKEIWSKTISIFPQIREILLTSKSVNIEEKEGVGNYVTSLDKKLDKYIHSSLKNIFPEATIISEESNVENLDIKELFFIVDPLDGTTNYINGWPHTVAIGVIYKEKLICGIIYDILSEKIYSGIREEGVFECLAENITVQKKIEKTEYKDTIKKSVICHDTPYGEESFKTTLKLYEELYKEKASIKTIGPISLDILKTALSRKNRPYDYEDAVWHMEVRVWDVAAATCILRELGGDLIDIQTGKAIKINKLTNPSVKIGFVASGSESLRNEIYSKYKKIN